MKWAWLVVVYLHVVTVTSQEVPQDNFQSFLGVDIDDTTTERQQDIMTERQQEMMTERQQETTTEQKQEIVTQRQCSCQSAGVVASTDSLLVKLQDVEKQNSQLLASMQQQMSSQAAQLAKLQADLSVGICEILQRMNSKGIDKLHMLNGKNYYFSDTEVSWSDALQICDENGMQLVSIETDEEWQAIESYLNNTFGTTRNWQYWTSGSDVSEEGTWVWASTGQPMTFHVCSDMDNSSRYNCMSICRARYMGCKWTDDQCSISYKFICEMSSPLCVN